MSARPAPGSTPELAPFRGLAPFGSTELDTLMFFGRERERDVVAANLLASTLTVLFGPTGVGKSSLLGAGVVPRLRGSSPVVVVFDEWAQQPVPALVRAIRDEAERVSGISLPERASLPGLADAIDEAAGLAGGEVHLLLDQFEEYFAYRDTLDPDDGLVRELGEALARPGTPATFLIAVRDDAMFLLDRLTPAIPGVLGNRLALDRLGHAAGEEAITGPIDRFNELSGSTVEIEPELVEDVLRDVGSAGPDTNGSRRGGGIEAPYLQLVMARLWEEERLAGSPMIRAGTLRSLGGAATIVTGHLEAALAALPPGDADVAATVLAMLVTPSGTKVAHSLSDLATYAASRPEATRRVLEGLVAARILRPLAPLPGQPQPRYEIFHDVLAEPIAAWRARHAAERELVAERERARRRHRRLSIGLGVALVAVAALAALTVFAFSQRGEAQDQARRAEAGRLAASATALLRTDPELSLLLGLEGAALAPTREVEDALREALIASRIRHVIGGDGDEAVVAAAMPPDGTRAYVLRAGGRLELVDTASGEPAGELAADAVSFAVDSAGARVAVGHPDGRVETVEAGGGTRALGTVGGLRRVSFTPDGGVLAVGRREVVLWDGGEPVSLELRGAPLAADATAGLVAAANDRTVTTKRTGRDPVAWDAGARVRALAVLPGGRRVVTGGGDGVARIWDAETGRLVHELPGHESSILAVAVTRDGTFVATGSADGSARIWDPLKGALHAVVGEHGNLVRSVTFDAEGARLVTTSDDHLARIWDVEGGRLLAELPGHRESVRSAAFGGDAVLTTSIDGTARVWDSRAEPVLPVLASFGVPVVSVSELPGGRLLAGRADGIATVLSPGGETEAELRHGGSLAAAAASEDGQVLATVGERAVRIWDGADGTLLAELPTNVEPRAVAVSPDGSLVAVALPERVWLLRDGSLELDLAAPDVAGIAVSPGGDQLATAHGDGIVRLWSAKTGELEATLEGHRDGVTAVAYGPDGSRLVSSSLDHDARIWDRGGGPALAVLAGHFALVSGASFSPDGRWVVTAGPGSGALWEAESGRLVSYLRGHDGPLSSALFLGEGPTIVTGGTDGTVRAWPCEICRGLDGLRKLASERLTETGRTLTGDERAKYVAGSP